MSQDLTLAALARLEAGQARLEAHRHSWRPITRACGPISWSGWIACQTRFDQLHEECFVAFSQSETARRHLDNTPSESRDLVEQISGLVRQARIAA